MYEAGSSMSMVQGINTTDLIEAMLDSVKKLYFIESKEPRTTMVAYQKEGEINELYLRLEMHFSNAVLNHLKLIRYDKVQKNGSVLSIFLKAFSWILDRREAAGK